MERLTQASNKGGVAFTFDLDITCEPSEAKKILRLAEKLKQYEDLGTVEELQQAKIKQIPNAWLNDDIEEKCICPCCRKAWSFYDNDTQTFEYCPNCGQKLT